MPQWLNSSHFFANYLQPFPFARGQVVQVERAARFFLAIEPKQMADPALGLNSTLVFVMREA